MCLPGPWGTVQDERGERVDLDRGPQDRPRPDRIGLADELVERAGTHASGKRSAFGEALLGRVVEQVAHV